MSNRFELVHSLATDFAFDKSPLLQRKEQIFSWSQSPTNKEKSDVKNSSRVRFDLSICFRSACANDDLEDAKALLECGVDINSKDVDGITSLHQACLDDNDEVLEFLLRNGADVNAQDMEGWTPLHTAAYCGYANLVERLIESGADVGLISCNGELPIDLAEEEAVSVVLRKTLKEKQIDIEEARNEERVLMLADIAHRRGHQKKLKPSDFDDVTEPNTKATPLHVAAAKGYIDVVLTLLESTTGMLEVKDVDGWTALHAAVHWGQKEVVRLLCEAGANMEATNNAMQSPSDLAEPDMTSYLRQLKEKYGVKLRRNAARNILDSAERRSLIASRRSSVNRLSMDQKMLMRMNKEKSPAVNMIQNLMLKNTLSNMLPEDRSEASDLQSVNEAIKNRMLKIGSEPTSPSPIASPQKSPNDRVSVKLPKMEQIFEEGSSLNIGKAHSTMATHMLSACVLPLSQVRDTESVSNASEKSDEKEEQKSRVSDPRVSLRSFTSIESEEPSIIIHDDEGETPVSPGAAPEKDEPVIRRTSSEEQEEDAPRRRGKINSLLVKSNATDWKLHRNAISEYDEESETVQRISLLTAPEKQTSTESQRIFKARQSFSNRRSIQGELEPVSKTSSTSSLKPIDETDNVARLEAFEMKLSSLEKSNEELKAQVLSFSEERELQLKTVKQLLVENEEIRQRLKAIEEENAALKRQSENSPATPCTMEELKEENSKLRDENSSLIRVISRLSKSRDQEEEACHKQCDRCDEHFGAYIANLTRL